MASAVYLHLPACRLLVGTEDGEEPIMPYSNDEMVGTRRCEPTAIKAV